MSAFGLDTFDDWGGEEEMPAVEYEDAAWVSCPYCGEAVELLVDPTGGSYQEYVEDCEICCRPWSVHVAMSGSGHPQVTVSTLDEN
jgi:hypothetical protein